MRSYLPNSRFNNRGSLDSVVSSPEAMGSFAMTRRAHGFALREAPVNVGSAFAIEALFFDRKRRFTSSGVRMDERIAGEVSVHQKVNVDGSALPGDEWSREQARMFLPPEMSQHAATPSAAASASHTCVNVAGCGECRRGRREVIATAAA